MDDNSRRISEQLRAGANLGDQLVGLASEVAFERAARAGFDPRVVGPDAEAITADLKPDRIWLFVSAEGIVRAAQPG